MSDRMSMENGGGSNGEGNGKGKGATAVAEDWTQSLLDEATANFARLARLPMLWQRAQLSFTRT